MTTTLESRLASPPIALSRLSSVPTTILLIFIVASTLVSLGYASPVPITPSVPILPDGVDQNIPGGVDRVDNTTQSNSPLNRRLFSSLITNLPSAFQSKMGQLTNPQTHVLLGFSYTGQLAGTQYLGKEFPLGQLYLPGGSPSTNELKLLPKASIKDDTTWKCFVVANRQAWAGTKIKMEYLSNAMKQPSLRTRAPKPPEIVFSSEQVGQSQQTVMRTSNYKGLITELGITSMCFNPGGKTIPGNLVIPGDVFAKNQLLKEGAQWHKWTGAMQIENWPANLVV
ncbi:hypothetical protein GGU10DRAFT_348045 [Lentinula aff. detonsa]|uniref:Uncharacterized protein n=1 Tax=Lentinula aff. detonsa TaxID=2804958 RepID=A0AA38KG60_9AGAR|nr:hypothetical protein GGU10DRAFT_348045 [Lentinula aff. detonsa]